MQRTRMMILTALFAALPVSQLLLSGMLLYLPGDMLKITVCGLLCRVIRPRISQFTLP